MTDGTLGITFRETMTGPFAMGSTDPLAGEEAGKTANTSLAMHAAVEIRDLEGFVADATHTGALTGHIDFPPLGSNLPAERGVFRLFSPSERPDLRLMVYELGFRAGDRSYYLAGRKEVANDRHGTDLWNDTTTLLTRLHEGPDASGPVIGAGVLRLGVTDLARLTSTVHVLNAKGPGDHARALALFGRFFLGSLWDTYGPRNR